MSQENNILDQVQVQEMIYSKEADRQGKTFFGLQNCILLLGVLITALAALQAFYKQMAWPSSFFIGSFKVNILYILLIAMTSLFTLLIAGTNRFNPGNKWVRMRTASEAFKREMFHYRTRTGVYSDARISQNVTTREATLARMLEIITKQWVENDLDYTLFPTTISNLDLSQQQTGAKFGRRKQPAPLQKLSTYLPPDGYISERLEDQLRFYRNRSVKLGRRLAWLQWFILGLGAIATLLAALQLELIITVTTATATAMATYLEYKQVSNTLKQYNHAIVTLINIRNWWSASGDTQAHQDTIDTLVERVENTLQGEQAGWVQQMQAALTELRERQEKRPD